MHRSAHAIAVDLAIELDNLATFLEGAIADPMIMETVAAMRRKAQIARQQLRARLLEEVTDDR